MLKLKRLKDYRKKAAEKIRLEEEAKRLAEEEARLKGGDTTLEAKIADIEKEEKKNIKVT